MRILFCTLFFFVIKSSIAQGNDVTNTIIASDKQADSLEAVQSEYNSNEYDSRKLNALKLNVSSLLSGNIALQYERHLSKRISVGLGFRIMAVNSVPYKDAVVNAIANSGELDHEAKSTIQTFINNATMNSWSITPEIRFYTRRNNKGFYVAPFIRHEQAKISSTLLMHIDNKDYNLMFDAQYKNTGGGLLLGWNFNIGKNFGIDWWILGPYIGGMKTNIHAYNFYIDPADMEEYKDQINDFKFENDWISGTVNATNTNADIAIKGTMVGVRAMGINFVYRF